MCSWILVFRRAIETTVRLYCIAAVYWNVYKCRGPEEGGAPCPPGGGGTALHSGSVRKNAHTAVDVSFILIILLIDDY